MAVVARVRERHELLGAEMHPDLINTIFRQRMTTLVDEANAHRMARDRADRHPDGPRSRVRRWRRAPG